MFYFLWQPPFRTAFILLVLLIPFFYWIDRIMEYLVSGLVSSPFYYAEPAHLKLIYLVLAVVFLGLTSAIYRGGNTNDEQIKRNLVKWIFTTFFAFILGSVIHLWMLVDVLNAKSSMMAFETNVMTYYIADYFMIISFSIGGFIWIKPLIHEN